MQTSQKTWPHGSRTGFWKPCRKIAQMSLGMLSWLTGRRVADRMVAGVFGLGEVVADSGVLVRGTGVVK